MKSVFDKNRKYIITLRDPKDFLISYINWLDKRIAMGHQDGEERWENATMEQKLDGFFMNNDETSFRTLAGAEWAMTNYFVASKLYHLGLENILFVRFEDLIGPELGGSPKEKQMETFKKICDFTGAKYTDERIQKLIEVLPGDTYTYTENKKVGLWKDFYQDRHKFFFNYYFAHIAVSLGYDSIPKDSYTYEVPEFEESDTTKTATQT